MSEDSCENLQESNHKDNRGLRIKEVHLDWFCSKGCSLARCRGSARDGDVFAERVMAQKTGQPFHWSDNKSSETDFRERCCLDSALD
jgi:hypothetical protein